MNPKLTIWLRTSSTSQTKNIGLNISVRSKHEHIKTVSSGDNRAIGLAYMLSQETTADEMIHIDSTSSQIRENLTAISKDYRILHNTSSFRSVHKRLVMTSYFKSSDVNLKTTARPLWWKHVLSNDPDDIDLGSVKVLNGSMAEVDTNRWSFVNEALYSDDDDQDTWGVIFNDLENSFDAKHGQFTVYYIQYTKSNGETIVELLNNSAIFVQRTLENVTYKYTYSVENENSTYYNVTIITPSGISRLAVQPSEMSRLQLDGPVRSAAHNEWYLRITNGELKRYYTYDGATCYYRYYIPEYYDQGFDPIQPYKLDTVKAQVLNRNLLSIPLTSLAYSTDSQLYINIIVKDKNNNAKYAFTSNPDIEYWVEYDYINKALKRLAYVNIADQLSVDERNGLLYLGNYSLENDDNVEVTAYYTTEHYEIRDINFNPALYPDILDYVYIVFVVPEVSSPVTSSVEWLVMEKGGRIIDWKEDSTISEFAANYINTWGYANWLASYTASGLYYYVTNEPTVFEVSSENENVIYTDFSASILISSLELSLTDGSNAGLLQVRKSILDDVTEEGDWFYDEDTRRLSIYVTSTYILDIYYAAYSFTADNLYQYLVLGEINVKEIIEPHDLGLLDIRETGGGIKTDYEDQSITAQPETLWYWDIGNWDVIPAPLMCVDKIGIPWFYRPINEDIDDLTKSSTILNAVDYRQSAGNYPLIVPWGPQPSITSFSLLKNGISFTLSDEDCGTNLVQYYFRYGTTPNKDEMSDPVLITSSDRTYRLTGLAPQSTYYLYVYAKATIDEQHWYENPHDDIFMIKTRG